MLIACIHVVSLSRVGSAAHEDDLEGRDTRGPFGCDLAEARRRGRPTKQAEITGDEATSYRRILVSIVC